MRSTTAQQQLLDLSEPLPVVPVVPVSPSAAPAGVLGDDGLPPLTKAQVFYWAQLCGELHLRGTAGIADADGWSADLVPSAPTLKALQARGLVARRDRAWKLRRRWYERLIALKARAVDTPALGVAERPAPDLPTYAELEAWEAVCRWLDVQPGRQARLPFIGLAPLLLGSRAPEAAADAPAHPAVEQPPGPFAAGQVLLGFLVKIQHEQEAAAQAALQAVGEHAALLKAMRRYRLVRHTQGCAWALSPRWREKLRDLHAGIERTLRESAPLQRTPIAARSLCAGLDTWALNWVVEDKALPARLHRELEDEQERARAQEGEVETRWVYDGVPLRMYQAGVRVKGDGTKAKGVSWSYILVNPSLRLLIRRTPLGGIVAHARLGSECLWRRTPRAALDELHALVRRLWGKQRGRWQVSYAHLAHDVANAPLEREHLDCYVSRSRRQAVYDAAQAELQRLLREARPHDAAGAELDLLDWDGRPLEDLFYDWNAEYGEDEELLTADAFAEEGYAWERWNRSDRWGRPPKALEQARAELEGEVKERAITSYTWGKRLSGVSFSPGGAVSFVMYRKDWEGRLKGKRYMEPLWKAAGWDGTAPVTRHEARLIREPLRELRAAGSERAILDDPWEFLEHLGEVWARMVGRVDACPEAVDVAWIRRVIPLEGESNRSRWDTDPVWRVVHQASFTSAPLAIRRLVRRTQRHHDLKQLDRQLLGVLEKREALAHPDPAGRDVSLALRDLCEPLGRELQAKGEPFDQAVRRKRQEAGLPVRLAAKVLPLRPQDEPNELDGSEVERRPTTALERAVDHLALPELLAHGAPSEAGRSAAARPQGGRWQTWVWLRVQSAEARMREAYAALEAAEGARGATGAPAELERLERAFAQSTVAYDAARSLSQHVI